MFRLPGSKNEKQTIKNMEPTTGIEPVDLFLTKEALYLLSYVGISICNGSTFYAVNR